MSYCTAVISTVNRICTLPGAVVIAIQISQPAVYCLITRYVIFEPAVSIPT